MKTYKVHGRIRVDIYFDETIKATSEDKAVSEIDKKTRKRHGILTSDIIDDDIYCEEV